MPGGRKRFRLCVPHDDIAVTDLLELRRILAPALTPGVVVKCTVQFIEQGSQCRRCSLLLCARGIGLCIGLRERYVCGARGSLGG